MSHSQEGGPALKTWRVHGAAIQINSDGLGTDSDLRFLAKELSNKSNIKKMSFFLNTEAGPPLTFEVGKVNPQSSQTVLFANCFELIWKRQSRKRTQRKWL